MRARIGLGILAAWLVSGLGAASSAGQSDEDGQARTTIRAEDIGRTVKVLGRLGYPLHEVVTVHGTWVAPEPPFPKPDITLRFRVDQVNGNLLDRPVDFRASDIAVCEKRGVEPAPAKGEQWELRAYETWPIAIHPEAYWEALGVPLPAPPLRDATRMVGVLKQRPARRAVAVGQSSESCCRGAPESAV